MNNKPVWCQEYDAHDLSARYDMTLDKAHLFAAVPALVRALLIIEWQGARGRYYDECACCGEDMPSQRGAGHKMDCEVDAALTAAGLATQEQRDAARKAMGT